MFKIWFFIYNIILIPVLWVFFRLYSLFNSKIRDGFSGRKTIFPYLEQNSSLLNNGKKNILIHSSSFGEFQQAIPIIEELQHKDYNIILTFFSPSGFKNSKVTFRNTIKVYLPFDSYFRIKKFFNLVKPDFIFLIRYDLWFNFLYRAKKLNIKTVIANARFDENDRLWRLPVFRSFKKILFGFIDELFVIDDADEYNYKKILGEKNSSVIKVGDSKFERVYQASKNIKIENILKDDIIKDKKVFVMGSSWRDDEEIVLPVVNKISETDSSLLTVLVPHEPKETKLLIIEKNIREKYESLSTIRYSNIQNYKGENLIIVDSIGKLMSLYSQAYMSYVGGGFKSGLHNILEPVIYNMPVFFSNIVKNSDEDEVLLSTGCGIIVKDKKQFYRVFKEILDDKNLHDSISEKCKSVFREKLGTAKKIVEHIFDN
jgi:3-deoxy-D-manno-octulosonic-acid transferase